MGYRASPVATRRNKAAESNQVRDMLRRPARASFLWGKKKRVSKSIPSRLKKKKFNPSCPNKIRRRYTAAARLNPRTFYFAASTRSNAQVNTGFLLPVNWSSGGAWPTSGKTGWTCGAKDESIVIPNGSWSKLWVKGLQTWIMKQLVFSLTVFFLV